MNDLNLLLSCFREKMSDGQWALGIDRQNEREQRPMAQKNGTSVLRGGGESGWWSGPPAIIRQFLLLLVNNRQG